MKIAGVGGRNIGDAYCRRSPFLLRSDVMAIGPAVNDVATILNVTGAVVQCRHCSKVLSLSAGTDAAYRTSRISV